MSDQEYGLGYIQSPPDERDYLLPLTAPSEPLPLKFNALDISGPLPILDQGKTPQCVAYASSAMKMFQEKRDENKVLGFDCKWLYNECKKIDGYPDEDGTSVRAAMTVLKKQGLKLLNRPDSDPARRKIAAYYKVPTDVHSLKLALRQYGPIVTGTIWFKAWFKPVDGILPKPDQIAGGHATDWVGWDDTILTPVGIGGFLAVNSWSEKWGLGGRFVVPYPFVRYLDEAYKAVDVIDGEEEKKEANRYSRIAF